MPQLPAEGPASDQKIGSRGVAPDLAYSRFDEEALSKGRPGFAAVDVFENEPMRDTEHPLLKLDNVICTPHLGYVEINAFNRSFDTMFDQVLAFDAGAPINVINPQVLTRMGKC